MPWWAIAYLVLLTVVILISVIKDFLDKKNLGYILAEFVSGAIGFYFVLSIWNEAYALMLGWFLVPMFLYSIIWDQYALTHMTPSSYEDLSDKENADMDRYCRIFAVIFVLPCYIAGGYLIYSLI